MKRTFTKFTKFTMLFMLIFSFVFITGCSDENSYDSLLHHTMPELSSSTKPDSETNDISETYTSDNIEIPEYNGEPYCEINKNQPTFTDNEITTASYEIYSKLDNLGRCGVAKACISEDLMPTEKRGNIGMIKPSGWHTVKYPDYIIDNYLYNRCHLIGYQLTGENANEKNLITGTRYLNVSGMLPFENEVADYIHETGNHVMYKVTPLFIDDELVARGVYMEAYSVEDHGDGVSFNVYCFNVQPQITIDYKTGDSYITNK